MRPQFPHIVPHRLPSTCPQRERATWEKFINTTGHAGRHGVPSGQAGMHTSPGRWVRHTIGLGFPKVWPFFPSDP
eukprot:7378822-Prymnesium_polylepis.1